MPGKAVLGFLATVNVAQIPLYLSLGPSLEVQTSEEATSQWFAQLLSDHGDQRLPEEGTLESWWERPSGQSDLGVLVRVEGEEKEGSKRLQATELLFYAACETRQVTLPTPPVSSSPGPDGTDASASQLPSIKLYALPLCSAILKHAQADHGLQSPPPEKEGHACFLPKLDKKADTTTKKRKIASLFDDATKQRRKLQRRGGESVAHRMAGLEASQPLPSLPSPLERSNSSKSQPSTKVANQRAGLARASTFSTLPSNSHSRPVSETAVPLKRSSLQRVESAYTTPGSIAIETENTILEQNKAALSKVVMAGMRLHGLQSKRKPTKEASQAALSRRSSLSAGILTEQGGEDEYKLVYHQTLKAALFAFRNTYTTQAINQGTMRDIVDRLLDIFCTDPESPTLPLNGFAPGPVAATPMEAPNPFDAPSSSAQAAAQEPTWSTLTIKKRKTGYFDNIEPG